MNRERAKEILLLYRPGPVGDGNPELTEALTLLEHDEELWCWFEAQRAAQAEIRRQFKKILPPAGLKEQIISERPWHTRPVTARHLLAIAAVVIVLFATGLWWSGLEPREDRSFAGYRNRMVSTAQRTYEMQLETDNLASIRAFLSGRGAPGDFISPAGLSQATGAGCLTLSWRGAKVSMICFKTGRPLPPAQASDLWLFVIDHASVPDAPETETPQIATVNQVTTASWTRQGKTYVLAVEGNEALLWKYF